VVAAIVVALLAGGIAVVATLRHLDHEYGPLRAGEMGGPYTMRGWIDWKDGSIRLARDPGASGQLITVLGKKDGAHSVKITALDHGDVVSDIRWSTYRVVNGGDVEGVDTPWRRFPAIVPAHGRIRLLITLHHPDDCPSDTKGGEPGLPRYGGYQRVHWESLLHDHTDWMRVYGFEGVEDPALC
jgi:hypothetical protein